MASTEPSPSGVHPQHLLTLATPAPIHLMENHDEAYHLWRNAGIKDRVLVHIDAHHDMWWIDDNSAITIANFICPALKEGIIGKVYWVVPDRAFADRAPRGELLQQIESVAREYRTPISKIRISADAIVVPLIGRQLVVTTLASLNLDEVPVLLDIDVDYLMIPQVAHNHADRHSKLPWCWPSELAQKIAEVRLMPEMVTISYSVEGCYTPLAWKYLGEELKTRLGGYGDSTGYECLRRGTIAAASGEVERAESNYRAAAEALPESAAPHYHLALLALNAGCVDDARAHCRRALDLDPSYGTAFNNLGFHYFWQRRDADAESEFRSALALNSNDAYAPVGMARLAARRKDWNQAIDWASSALAVSDDNLDAHRCIGQAYARTGHIDLAIEHYERSLVLGLHGHKPLSWHILTCTQPQQFTDIDHAATYAELGRLQALKGEIDRAISCYRMALGANHEGVAERARLAHLYLKIGRRHEAVEQLQGAIQQLPSRARRQIRRGWSAIASRAGRLAARSKALA